MGYYRKSLGQHILQNVGAAKRIVDSLEAKEGDSVLEIGPGRGALTGLIADRGVRLLAVEVDDRMVTELTERFGDRPNVSIRNEDILSFDFNALDSGLKWKVIGNLPYNITSPILERMFEHYHLFSTAVLTVQREVGDRMTSKVGGSEYSALTVFVRSYCDSERILLLKPGSFFPAPKVDSAVVRLRFRATPVLQPDLLSEFHSFTQGLFGHRRKTVLNGLVLATSLERSVLAEIILELGIAPSSRPQNLSAEQFVSLFLATRSSTSD
jgi:16S rRNA (adenine1518-N6/adenine1519-N6)-dimethyltransferase